MHSLPPFNPLYGVRAGKFQEKEHGPGLELTGMRRLPYLAAVVLAGVPGLRASAVRELPVKFLIAGPRAPKDVCRDLSEALTDVSRDFQAFGVGFSVSDCSAAPEFGPGDPVTRPMLAKLAARAVSGGIVVLSVSGGGDRHGLSDFRRGVSAISFDPSARRGPRRILEHEIGHLFGAVHVADTSSPMHPQAGRGGLDAASRRRIQLLRERRFEDEAVPVPEETWRDYVASISVQDDASLPAGQRDRSTMLIVALEGLGENSQILDELARARSRGEMTPELTLAGIRAELAGGGPDLAVRALSDIHRLGSIGVDTVAGRAEAVAILLQAADAADRVGDLGERDADLALVESESPVDAALSRASIAIEAGDPDGARFWLDLAGSAAPDPFAAQLECAEAIERGDVSQSRCRCGAIESLSGSLARDWAELALREGDYSSAARAWEEWLLRRPDDSYARQARVLALMRLGDRDEALRELEKARSLGVEFRPDLEREIRNLPR